MKPGDTVTIKRVASSRTELGAERAMNKTGVIDSLYFVGEEGTWWRVAIPDFPIVVVNEAFLALATPIERDGIAANSAKRTHPHFNAAATSSGAIYLSVRDLVMRGRRPTP